jgi:hypothetical protein
MELEVRFIDRYKEMTEVHKGGGDGGLTLGVIESRVLLVVAIAHVNLF